MELKEIESAIEGILFAAGEPVGVERLCLTLEIDRAAAEAVCQRLADYYSMPSLSERPLKAAGRPSCPSLRWRYWPSLPTISLLPGLMWTKCAV